MTAPVNHRLPSTTRVIVMEPMTAFAVVGVFALGIAIYEHWTGG